MCLVTTLKCLTTAPWTQLDNDSVSMLSLYLYLYLLTACHMQWAVLQDGPPTAVAAGHQLSCIAQPEPHPVLCTLHALTTVYPLLSGPGSVRNPIREVVVKC
jgi:hypothetical protein